MRLGAIEAGGTKFVLGVGDEFGHIFERKRIETRTPEVTLGEAIGFFKDKEVEADAKMAELESNIRSVLQQLGEPTSMVDEIHSTYLAEKAAKKAYYLGLH